MGVEIYENMREESKKKAGERILIKRGVVGLGFDQN